MAKPLTSGIYRVRQDVCGPRGLARVERVPDPEAYNERYTVRFYAKEAPRVRTLARPLQHRSTSVLPSRYHLG